MNAAYYAAGFAQDLNLSDAIKETMGYSSGTAAFAVTVGSLMESMLQWAESEAQDCWPLVGAEAAANFLNSCHDDLPLEDLHTGALAAAVHTAMTEGKAS